MYCLVPNETFSFGLNVVFGHAVWIWQAWKYMVYQAYHWLTFEDVYIKWSPHINPYQVPNIDEYISVVQAIFEGLVTLDSKTLMPLPAIAELSEISDDEKDV